MVTLPQSVFHSGLAEKAFLILTRPPYPFFSLGVIDGREIPFVDTVLESFAPDRGFEVLVRSTLKGIPG